tara:strand:+ start:1122 stop:3158 length:2037 start_codon:yes stop_codon:yes gene_type:complete
MRLLLVQKRNINKMSHQPFSSKDCNAIAYDLAYFPLDFADAPVNGMLCTVEPKAFSRIHNHVEVEFFYFVAGVGNVYIDDECIPVKVGEGIRVAAFANHIVENTHASDPLQFISFYWVKSESQPEDPALYPKTKNTLIFSTPPTPNGDLHLGHLSGPYLAADIYRRHLLGLGYKALHATGRDDHQTYVPAKALLEKSSPEKTADKYAQAICETWQCYNIDLDFFIEPQKEGAYANFINKILQHLYDNSYLVTKTEDAAWDSEQLNYLHEAYIRGNCPNCNNESDGNACEECGRPNQCIDLSDAYARLTNHKIIKKPCKRLYFRLSLFAKELNNYVQSTPMSAHAYALSQGLLAENLPDICISHPSSWGMKIPIDAFSDQVLYVWFEMALAYLWAARNLAPASITDEIEKIHWFYQNQETQVVHFYGFDNTFYHTILFPAIYFALGGLRPPAAHAVNELLDLEGKKFSTSRGHLISGKALLESAPIDSIRWFLSEVRPEGMRSNFQLNVFYESVNSLFAENLQTLITSLAECISHNFQGIVPEPGAWTKEQRYFYQELLSLRQHILKQLTIEQFSLRGVTSDLRQLITKTLYFQETYIQFFKEHSVRDHLRTGIALSLLAIKFFALLARPIIPNYSRMLLTFLGLNDTCITSDIDFLLAGVTVTSEQLPYFERLHENDK